MYSLSVTGNINVIGESILANCKDNAIVANSGHFDAEIDLDYLKKNCNRVDRIRPFVEQYFMKDGRRINVLAEGRACKPRRRRGPSCKLLWT